MAPARIQIAEDKGQFVKALRQLERNEGMFETYGDILTFAAALGFARKRRVPVEKVSRKDPDPVLQEQFREMYIIKLIAVLETDDPKILSSDEECDRERAKIFQEYANGGLEILKDELKGSTDWAARILLMLERFRDGRSLSSFDEFDLSAFL